MQELLPGLQKFSKSVYPNQVELFNELAQGQSPHTMFITCSDSRIDPNLFTQTKAGELFVLRNAGNIVPAFGATNGGEESTIEFGVKALGVKKIVVCGHSKCGAMSALLNGLDTNLLPSTTKWLGYSETKKEIMHNNESCLNGCIETNVLTQIKNLKTHPSVANKIANKQLQLFGMVYHFDRGFTSIYNKREQRFLPATEINPSTEQMRNDYSL